MSFNYAKDLTCDFCNIRVEIGDVNFPEDLYDLIVKHKVEQLYWLCVACKRKKEQTFSHVLNLAEKQIEMEQMLKDLNDTVKNMKQERSDNFALPSGYSSGETSFSTQASDIFLSADEMGNVFSGEPDSASNGIATQDTSASASLESKSNFSGNFKSHSEFWSNILKTNIKINPVQERQSKKIVSDFLNMLTNAMKKTDELFSALYQKPYYTGSFYEDLRIKEATEFDINLLLKFPFPSNTRNIEYPKTVKSFAKYKLTEVDFSKASLTEQKKELCNQVAKKFFQDGYLMPDKVLKWLQSIIAKMNIGNLSIDDVTKIRLSSSGPAKTLKLDTTFGYTIDIDLVPVIEIIPPEWPPGADKDLLRKFNVPQIKQFWFLVPKTYCGKIDISQEERERFWRMHFPEVEKEILHNRGMVKPIIKLLKLLRDKQNWKILSSYYLKTVVMWTIKENPEPKYWSDENFTARFIQVLKKLQSFLEESHIPYLFYPSYNLIEKMSKAHADNVRCRLKKIISSVEVDSKSIVPYIQGLN